MKNLPPPPPPDLCPECGNPVVPFTEAIGLFNIPEQRFSYDDLMGQPIHVPIMGEVFYFMCGWSR